MGEEVTVRLPAAGSIILRLHRVSDKLTARFSLLQHIGKTAHIAACVSI